MRVLHVVKRMVVVIADGELLLLDEVVVIK
jgi:hypothetical protein